MSTFKKIVSLVLVVALTAAVSIGGTLAYLTSEDSDVNVMTMGNVSIKQHEYERKVNDDGSYATIDTVRGTSYELVDFTQAKPLLPTTCELPSSLNWDETNVYFAQLADGTVKEGDMHYYGLMNVFPAELTNVQDKFVFVENTGKTDAYVRTIIALEAGSCTVAKWDSLIRTSTNGFWTYTLLENTVNINGNNYVIMVCNYTGSGISGTNGRHPDGIVHPGDYTYNNLAQVYMASTTTNEDIEAIDGNNNGTYDILVLSQAVQADGFENAATALTAGFGEVTAANVQEWFGSNEFDVPDVASTSEDVLNALLSGESVIANSNEYNVFSDVDALDAKGATVTLTGTNSQETYHGYFGLTATNASISNLTVTGSGLVELGDYYTQGGNYTATNLVLDDVASTLANGDKGYTLACTFCHYGTATLNNCVMTGATAIVEGALPVDAGLVNGTTTTVNGGEYGTVYCWSKATATFNGVEVDTLYAAPNTGVITIGADTHVGTLNLNYSTGLTPNADRLAKLVIVEGATVDTIIFNGNSYTQAGWAAFVAENYSK